MKTVTTKQMSEIENNSEKLGVSKKILMQNAGIKLAGRITEICRNKNPENTNITFLAGSGNNGGDCFAASNILINKGYNVTVINLVRAPSTELAKECFSALPDKVRIINGCELNNNQKIIQNAVISSDILVDGVFGTGFHGQLKKEIADIFSISTNAYRIAVDIPSGGDGSNGTISHGCFRADETLCLGCLKFGMTQYPLKKMCGKITVADIGLPHNAYDIIEGEHGYHIIEPESLSGFPPVREPDSHKGTFGTVLIIAGSSSMRGAAVFAVLGALKSGAGLVKIASVEKCIDTVSVLAPEAVYLELESDEQGFMLLGNNRDSLIQAMNKADSIVIGSGMGVTENTSKIIRFVLDNSDVPVIVDADGINCIAGDITILENHKSDVIITPHPGEMARLLGCSAKTVNENRIVSAEQYAEKYGITVVLKGAGTVVADKFNTSANHTGNAGMSRGGSGDILSGIIGSVVAQGFAPYDSACAGVYIHGLAGDKSAEKYGHESMLPRDVIDCLTDAFRILKNKQKK
ncbi:MAG: NAD(P)H-hydrate dehydratase [Ruminococcus sp.]|nr:NAD(P)H-hydrate dehydratase [Ruminococcus sp.]